MRAVQRLTVTHESLLRAMIRLTIEREPDGQARSRSTGSPLRGTRRVDWIELALAPIHERLDESAFQRLVSALSLCIGIEALLILRDIRGLDASGAEAVSRWTAQALLRASLEEPGDRGVGPEQENVV